MWFRRKRNRLTFANSSSSLLSAGGPIVSGGMNGKRIVVWAGIPSGALVSRCSRW